MVPGAQLYVLGALADRGAGGHLYKVLLPSLEASAAACVFATGALPGWTVALAAGLVAVLGVFYFLALYKVYYQYSRGAAAMLVLSVIFFFMPPFCLFAISGRKPFRY